MRLVLSFACLSILVAAPLAAEPTSSREEVSSPPGKLHALAFRTAERQPCVEAKLNPSGNRIATTAPARDTTGCAAHEALMAMAER